MNMNAPFLIELVIEPKDSTGREALITALGELAGYDSSLGFTLDGESGQVLLKGVSDEQLDAAERDEGVDGAAVGSVVSLSNLSEDMTPARAKIADHEAGMLLGRDDLDLHDRLEQNRAAFLQRFAPTCSATA